MKEERMTIEEVKNIFPPHEVRDNDKVNRLFESMKKDGYTGHALLIVDCGDYEQSFNGTHRLAAINKIYDESPTQEEAYSCH